MTSPEQALIRRTALRITVLTACLFTVCLLVIAALAALFILRAQNADGLRQLHAAVEDDDAVTDPPSGIVIYQSTDGRVRSSPQLHGRPVDPVAFAAVATGGGMRTGTITANGTTYLVRTDHRGTTVVQAALDLSTQNRERHRLVEALVAAGLLGLLAALAIGWLIARRAVRPLELASQRQRRFVADASHELRTPLAQAHLRAQMLQRSLADQSALAAEADQLVRSTRQLGDIVDELLLSAQLTVSPQASAPVDIATLATEAVDAEQVRARDRGVTIVVQHDAGPHLVAGSPTALRRVLNALLDNALGHVEPTGHITVTVDRDQASVVCTVSDNGSGF
ncbi:MAG TPA: HAMP domain-containing sensor histidine kinase, partial [Micromonosporaceae bacterium]